MQGVLDHFLAAESDVYLILQLKDGPETADVRFESFARLEQMGSAPNLDHYEAVYFANTPAYFYGMSNAEALEELYLTFNLKRPPDFRGMKEAARPQKSVAAQIKQAKEAAPKAKTKKHKERDVR